MRTTIARETVLKVLKKYNKKPSHILHTLTVEGVMRWFARDQGYGEEEDFWGITSLLRDTDFKTYPEQHRVKASELLREAGVGDELIHIVYGHGYDLVAGAKPEHRMEKILLASDELTGLIGAVTRMRLSGSVMDMEVSGPKKKPKNKCFTAGCSRDVIREGAEELDWTPEELMDRTIRAMRSCGAAVDEETKTYEA